MNNCQSTYTSCLDILIYDQALTYLQREERGGLKEKPEAALPPCKKAKKQTSRIPAKAAKAA